MAPSRNDLGKRHQLRGLGKELMRLDIQNCADPGIGRGPRIDFSARFGLRLKKMDAELYDNLKPFKDAELLEANGEEILDALIRLPSEDDWRDCLNWYLNIVSLAGRADLYFRLVTLHETTSEGWHSNLPRLLIHAARGGSIEIMVSLLAVGASVQLVRDSDWGGELSPFHWAAKLGHRSVVAALADAGAPLELKHMLGGTALSMAVDTGHGDVVLELLGAGADVNSIRDRGYYNSTFPEYTQLCIAAVRNNTTMVDTLLAADAHLGNERATAVPLHLAAERGCLGPVDALLAAGASIKLVDADGRSALHMACLHAYPEKLQNRSSLGSDDLHRFPTYSEGGRTLERLLLAGAEVDLTDDEGHSALHVACMHSHARAIELLLQYGASLNLLCLQGRSPEEVVAVEALTRRERRQVSPATLDSEETSVANGISNLIRRASAWRRRGWLIMTRARYEATVRPIHQALCSPRPAPEAESASRVHNSEDTTKFDMMLSEDGVLGSTGAPSGFAKGSLHGLGGTEGSVKILGAEGRDGSGHDGWRKLVILLVECSDESGVFQQVLGFL